MVYQHHLAAMVFRLPTQLESFVPPPNEQLSLTRPWRGTFTLHGTNASERANGHQQVCVTAAETDGDNRMDLWPAHLGLYIARRSCRLADLQEWVRRNKPPLCMFMPDRLPDASASRVNENQFRSLARLLMESQSMAIIPWNAPDRLPGAGIILFPTSTSTGLLAGAIFLNSPFPDFIVSGQSNHHVATGSNPQPFPQATPPSLRQPYTPSSHRHYQSADTYPYSSEYASPGNPTFPSWP